MFPFSINPLLFDRAAPLKKHHCQHPQKRQLHGLWDALQNCYAIAKHFP